MEKILLRSRRPAKIAKFNHADCIRAVYMETQPAPTRSSDTAFSLRLLRKVPILASRFALRATLGQVGCGLGSPCRNRRAAINVEVGLYAGPGVEQLPGLSPGGGDVFGQAIRGLEGLSHADRQRVRLACST